MPMRSEGSGVALVISAPSGTGKSTLVTRLRERFPEIGFSISCTTRSPRPGEINGREYHFVTPERFRALTEEGCFAEWAEVHGNLYGTPLDEALRMLEQGRDLLFDIDVQGAAQLRKSLPRACFVFIFPPSREELRRRLEKRGAINADTLEMRLRNAAGELRQSQMFDYWIVNHDLETALEQLCAVYLAQRLRRERQKGLERIISDWEAAS